MAESQWQVADLVAKKQENTKTWQQQISLFSTRSKQTGGIQNQYVSINKYKGTDESESDSYGVFISYKYIYEEMHIGIRGCL